MNLPFPIVIAGPTGTGKTGLALALAAELQQQGQAAEIISADSIAVYRGFDIGAAKPSPAQQRQVPHHLIDICAAHEDFTAGDFVRAAEPILQDLRQRDVAALVVGGTGFYIKALLQGMAAASDARPETLQAIRRQLEDELQQRGPEALYTEMLTRDPALAAKIHPNDTYRVLRALEVMRGTGQRWSEANAQANTRQSRYPGHLFCVLEMEREELRERLHARAVQMLEAGLLQEVENLLADGVPASAKAMLSVGYRECLEYLGQLPCRPPDEKPKDFEDLAERIARESLRLAKSQRTWFRGQHRTVETVPAGPGAVPALLAAIAARR